MNDRQSPAPNPGRSAVRYVVVTPARDEVAHIARTIASMEVQTILPQRWIIVDDGSTDGTSEIVDREAGRHDWIRVVRRGDRGFRLAGGGVMDAFLAGYAGVDSDWDFLVKLDADLSFSPTYFEDAFRRFAADPRLGLGGGTVYRIESGALRIDSIGDPPFHVRGATKIYRRACWDDIGLPIKAAGWDTIDEMRANLHGWTTRSFADLRVVQHKPTGAAAGRWADSFKNGRANYMTGYHGAFMLAKCAKRSFRKPWMLESIALFAGYVSGYLRRLPRAADRATIRYVRRQQVRCLLFLPCIYR